MSSRWLMRHFWIACTGVMPSLTKLNGSKMLVVYVLSTFHQVNTLQTHLDYWTNCPSHTKTVSIYEFQIAWTVCISFILLPSVAKCSSQTVLTHTDICYYYRCCTNYWMSNICYLDDCFWQELQFRTILQNFGLYSTSACHWSSMT